MTQPAVRSRPLPRPDAAFSSSVTRSSESALGLAVDDPPPAEIDEYFAQDSSLSWGPPPDDEKGIRDFMRILKKNGICWNRDRLHWPGIEKERGKFDFGGRFGLYRRIAEEEGIKALDTFHAAPPWNSESPTRFRDADPRRNLYPVNLLAAGESWSAIVRHWGALKALEVWNEPDISFGNDFPAEYVTAFTKAVSRSFADNGIDALVVGGVFASTRPGTNFYRTYIDNGLLDDSDVISYHSYAEVPDMEPQVAALRQAELDSGTPRAGIPYWITECGKPRPWTGTSRGPAEPDLYSAAEITGKAAELRALGLERYFAFEYKFRRENANNFGQMDANRTPMRGMAAYLHLVRVLSHRDYVGDLKGSDALRSRVFEGKDDLVAVLYNGTRKNRKSSVSLPSGLGVLRATGIDGRPVEFRNGRVPNTDGITYVYLDKAAKQNFIDPGTRAMELCRLAKSYRPRPRARKAARPPAPDGPLEAHRHQPRLLCAGIRRPRTEAPHQRFRQNAARIRAGNRTAAGRRTADAARSRHRPGRRNGRNRIPRITRAGPEKGGFPDAPRRRPQRQRHPDRLLVRSLPAAGARSRSDAGRHKEPGDAGRTRSARKLERLQRPRELDSVGGRQDGPRHRGAASRLLYAAGARLSGAGQGRAACECEQRLRIVARRLRPTDGPAAEGGQASARPPAVP
ncbi:MAG: hypothetical protein V8T86_06835 [Victivallis sp.]